MKQRTHQPCPLCDSSDAGAYYDDGHFYCFSCEGTIQPENVEVTDLHTYRIENKREPKAVDDIPWTDRNISEAVVNYYDVSATDRSVRFPYYDAMGMRQAAKIRNLGKVFSTEGDFKDCVLFGMHTLSKAGSSKGDTIIVTEGEADALAAFQMANNISQSAKTISKRGTPIVPAISIKSGAASAERDFKNHLEFLEGFSRVFICLDSDSQGQKSVERCAKLLKPGKAFIVKLEHKDPCEYTKRGLSQEFVGHLKDAVCYTPAGICNASTNFEGLWSEQNQRSIDFPWTGLQSKTLGTRAREIVTWAAGTGVGKSSMLRELQHHYLKNTQSNIGVIALEESVDRTRRGILSVEASDRLHLNEVFKK